VALLNLQLARCSPVATFRPASGLMPGRRVEVGVGAAVVSPRPFVEEPARATGQVWVTTDAADDVSVTAVSAFDSNALAFGGALRWRYVRTDRVAGGLEGELGYAWAALSVPLALRAVEETWLYTSPRVGTWGTDLIGGLPAGVSVHIIDGFMLRGEVQVSWQDFQRFNRRTHGGIAAAYQW
jgi:hypothetical protein